MYTHSLTQGFTYPIPAYYLFITIQDLLMMSLYSMYNYGLLKEELFHSRFGSVVGVRGSARTEEIPPLTYPFLSEIATMSCGDVDSVAIYAFFKDTS